MFCPKNKIFNPNTGKCVSKTSKIGKAIIDSLLKPPVLPTLIGPPDPVPTSDFITRGGIDYISPALFKAMDDFDKLTPAEVGNISRTYLPLKREMTEFKFTPEFMVTYPSVIPVKGVNSVKLEALIDKFLKIKNKDEIIELYETIASIAAVVASLMLHKYNYDNGYYLDPPKGSPKIFANTFEDILELVLAKEKFVYKLSNLISFIVYMFERGEPLYDEFYNDISIYISLVETSDEVIEMGDIVNKLNDGKGGYDFGDLKLKTITDDPNIFSLGQYSKTTGVLRLGVLDFYKRLNDYQLANKLNIFTKLGYAIFSKLLTFVEMIS